MRPSSSDLIATEARLGAHNYQPLDVVLARGEGVHVFDVDGNRYLDCLSAYSAVNQGHCHPKILKAMVEQAQKLTLTSRAFRNDQLAPFYEELAALTGSHKILPMNSGAEAVETAIKAVRKWGYEVKGVPEGAAEIIVCANNFHGRTIGIVGFSTDPTARGGFGPFAPGFRVIPFGDAEALAAAINPNTVGFLVEPIQGEGGIRDGSDAFIKGLRDLSDENDLMLVFDEVQCGVARTGTLYAYEQYGVLPDIMATAKGIGGGFPMGACLATEKAARGMVFGTHGSTYGGNPLAMAAGEAVLDIVATPEFLSNVRATGERLRGRLEQFIGNYPDLFELVRGRGLMLGVKMKIEPRAFVAHLRDNHQLLTVSAGDNTLRVLPPLVIDDSHIDEFMDKLSAGAASYKVEATPS